MNSLLDDLKDLSKQLQEAIDYHDSIYKLDSMNKCHKKAMKHKCKLDAYELVAQQIDLIIKKAVQ